MNHIIIEKVQTIQRCIMRARQELAAGGENFAQDYTRQDAAILNVLRACETTIDLANHIIRIEKLGAPASSRESFEILARVQIIPADLQRNLNRMVGFRNLSVHAYEKTDIQIVVAIIQTDLNDLLKFTDLVMDRYVDS